MIRKFKNIVLVATITLISSCSTSDLDPTLAQSKSVDGSVNNTGNLESILKGAHDKLTEAGYYGRDIIAGNEVRSDNCFSNGNSGRFANFAEYQYNANSGFIWDEAYEVIANANIIINAEASSIEGNQDQIKHIQGQALALRALAHYDLLRTYGQQNASGDLGVPIITTFKGEDIFPSRNSINEVKDQIYKDLETAYSMMNSEYDTSKVLISKFAAKALESRVAIYFGDYTRAKDAAKLVIDSGLYSIADKDSYVSNWGSGNANNTIFEIAFAGDDNRGPNSLAYIYRFPGDAPAGYGDVEVMSDVINIFEDSDVRKEILGYQDGGNRLRNMKKYPDTANGSDDIPLIRIEEVVLNYAEALLETGGDALTELNKITAKRGATAYTSVTKENILLERRKELMFEGFRFDDLMRANRGTQAINSNQGVIKDLSYPNNLFAYPIPNAEVNANSNMVQNTGY